MLQFPFVLPVPQAWQRTQSRMLSHTAWKPWAERQGGVVKRQPMGSKGGHCLQKAKLERQCRVLTLVPGQGQKEE